MYIKAPWEMSSYFTDIVADELNVKKVEMKDDVRDFSSYSFKPQLKTVGPKFGKQVGEIRNALAAVDGNAAMDEINATGSLKLALSGGEVELAKDDLLIETAQVEGFESMSDFGITVVLDLNLTDDLVEEGFIRELVSKIQTMRKDAGFDVTDRIRLTWRTTDKLNAVLNAGKEEVMRAVLAVSAEEADAEEGAYAKEYAINGENAVLGVKVASSN